MDRILIVPAAGRGSRLGAAGPKALIPVAGQPMLDHLLRQHGPSVDRLVVVVAPAAVDDFTEFAARRNAPIDLAIQQQPTGMLDAILAAEPTIAQYRPRRIAITWCDQIAVSGVTIDRLRARALTPRAAALVFPTIVMDRPYIHFNRDAGGRIVGVRQRREGDVMPERGEADMGLFDLSLDTYLNELTAFARGTKVASGTGERNFLPFIPWIAERDAVETIPGIAPIEALGVNTPDELAAVEAYLARQAANRS